MNRQLAEKILETASSRAGSAEVIMDLGESSEVSFENNRMKYVTSNSMWGAGVRVISNGRIGFSCTTDPEKCQQVVQHALEGARFGQEAKFEFPSQPVEPEVKTWDQAVADYPVKSAIETCRMAIDGLLTFDPSLDCGAGVGKSDSTRIILNTSGLDLEMKTSALDYGFNALSVGDDGSMIHVDEGNATRHMTMDMEYKVSVALEKLERAREKAKLKSGKIPVIMAPSALDMVLSPVASNCSGKMLQKGSSLLEGKIGEKMLDQRVTLIDDSLVDYAIGSMPFDAEGVPSRRLPLFEKGVFRNFVFDLQSAGLTGNQSTGSAHRGYNLQPSPGYGNVRMEPGTDSLDDIISGLKYGLLVYQVLGAGQSNTITGEFSVNVELAFLVENGRIIGRVKDAMLAGNAFKALSNIESISSETEWHASEELPYVCFKELYAVAGEE